MALGLSVIDRKAFDRISGYIEHAKTGPNTKIIAGGKYDDRLVYSPTFLNAFSKSVLVCLSNVLVFQS